MKKEAGGFDNMVGDLEALMLASQKAAINKCITAGCRMILALSLKIINLMFAVLLG